MGPRALRGARWGVVVAAITVLLGHICAGPLDAETVTPFDHHASAEGHGHGTDGDIVHAGSCEMARSPAGSTFSGTAHLSVRHAYVVAVQRLERASALPVTPHATSPPLFLVHAALLI